MNSFVKPSARGKFGLALTSSTALALAPIAALPAHAATFTVDTCAQFGTGGQVGLGDAVTAANNSVGLDLIDMSALSSCTMTIATSMEIADSVSINGGDAVTLQLTARTPIFTFASGVALNVSVSDLIMDGLDGEWASGFNLTPTLPSTLTVTGVTLRDFDLTALYSRNANTAITVIDSTFTNNQAPGGAGAIRSSGPVTVINSAFTNNVSTNGTGGAIRVDGSTLTITGSTFSGNNANRAGAVAVMYEGSSLTVTDDAVSTFTNNSTDWGGGGALYTYAGTIYFEGESEVTHLFSGNTAARGGGAIGVGGYLYAPTVNIDSNISLINNTARDGGAFYFYTYDQGTSSVDFDGNIYAAYNTASQSGGAFYFNTRDALGNAYVSELNINFTGDSVNISHNSATGGKGGAVNVKAEKGDATLSFSGAATHFQSNSALSGGAIAVLSSNEQGSWVYDTYLNITGGVVTMPTNSATAGKGGAILSRGFNVAILGGGPNYVGQWPTDPEYYLEKNYFNFNSATGGGGFAHVYDGATLDLQLAVIYANSAPNSAAIEAVDSQVILTASTVQGNVATTADALGVVSLYDTNFESVASLFAYNTGFNTIYSFGGEVGLFSNNFVANQNYDSAVYHEWRSSYGLVAHHNTFVNNTSTGRFSAYSSIVDFTYNHLDPQLKTIGANIFYSSDLNQKHLYLTDHNVFGHGNLLTGLSGSTLSDQIVTFDPSLGDTHSMFVSGDQLDLLGLDNFSNPSNPGINLMTVGIGPESVAIDLLKELPIAPLGEFPFDSRYEQRLNFGTLQPINGDGFDAGAFEYVGTPRDGDDDQPATEPNVSITSTSKDEISSGGDTFKVFGRGLDGATTLYVGDVQVGFDVISSTELLVTTGSLPAGRYAIRVVADNGSAVYQDGILVVAGTNPSGDPKFWTKRLSDGTAKIYASNIVGVGKVQFFVNGKEVAWVRAVDGTDPKLRHANGVSYLVRTVELKDTGKTRLEVKVDGKRVRFTTYVN